MTAYRYRRIFLSVKHLTLKQAREAKGWTQQDLEAATARRGSRVDQRSISKIERGGTDDPQNSTVAALEAALGLRRGTLVFGRQELSA